MGISPVAPNQRPCTTIDHSSRSTVPMLVTSTSALTVSPSSYDMVTAVGLTLKAVYWPAPVSVAKPRGRRPLPCGEEANLGKLLSAEAAWEAAEACMQTHGGFAYAVDYDIERKWREARVQRTAPISTNLILSYVAEHVLGLPRSY